jgi:hypothetical protein
MSDKVTPSDTFRLQASDEGDEIIIEERKLAVPVENNNQENEPKDDDNEFILEKKNIVVSVENNNQENEDEIEVIKSSKVKKEDQIELEGKDTLFKFDCKAIDDDKLCLKLTEIDALAPFEYIREIDMDGLQEKHKLFKSLQNSGEAEYHINRLFKQGRIKLVQKKEDEIIFKIKADYISEEISFDIEAERKMTDRPDAMMLKLYKIQKQKDKLIKEIENLVLNGNYDSKELAKKIKEIKEKYEI